MPQTTRPPMTALVVIRKGGYRKNLIMSVLCLTVDGIMFISSQGHEIYQKQLLLISLSKLSKTGLFKRHIFLLTKSQQITN